MRTKEATSAAAASRHTGTIIRGAGHAHKNYRVMIPKIAEHYAPVAKCDQFGTINVQLDEPLDNSRADYWTPRVRWYPVSGLGAVRLESFGFIKIKLEFPIGGQQYDAWAILPEGHPWTYTGRGVEIIADARVPGIDCGKQCAVVLDHAPSSRRPKMRRPAKDFYAFALSVGLCGFAVWKELQWVAVAAFVAALCVTYKPTVVRLLNIVLQILGRVTRAKVGDLEIQVGGEVVGRLLAADAPFGMQSVVSAMGASHVGFMLAIEKSGKIKVTGGILKWLRELRNLGLIEHDEPEIGTSSQVWLSEFGRSVTKHLRKAGQPAAPVAGAESSHKQSAV